MKACIYGAGAIGGWIGVALARAGARVSVVARGATLQAVQAHGLRIIEGGQVSAVPVRASDDTRDLGPQDLVVVAVKAPALSEVARGIGPLLSPATTVMSAMNGVPWWFFEGFGASLAGTRLESVDPGGVVARAIPGASVVGCVVHASCALEGPGFVRHNFGQGLIVGEPGGQRTPRLAAIAQALAGGGLEVTVSDQIQRDVWFKLWGNMTVNPVSAITGGTTADIMDDPLLVGLLSQVMLEAKAIGARIGIPIDQTPEDRHALTRKLGPFKSSMLQDAEAGRRIELDALVGAVREIGQRCELPTPWTDALLGLARVHARVHGLY